MNGGIFKQYIFPVATLTGGIIGVGFLSLPYIAMSVGLPLMLLYFAVLTAVVMVVHVMFGRVCLATPDFKRWPGFVGFYFGPWARRIMSPVMVAGSFGILLVYLIVGGQFSAAIGVSWFGGAAAWYVAVFFIAASACVYFGVRLISRIDFLALISLLVILALIFFRGSDSISLAHLLVSTSQLNMATIFLPYGAIMFSLWGIGLVPEIEEMVPAAKKNVKGIVIASVALAALFYLVFMILILSITGGQTTPTALTGLAGALGSRIASVALLIGLISTFVAFVAQGLLLKKVFTYDVGLGEFYAWALTCCVPLVLLLLGVNSFIPLISFIGGVLLSIDGILVLLMYRNIGGKAALVYPLIIFFILGIIYELIHVIN